jgi:HPt (histidine-containing phosphotransfer) domain-containing protein
VSDDRIAALWERFRGPVHRQLETLVAWHNGEVDPAAALQEAHKLAGVLGSFGRPDGSVAAAELEARVIAHLEGTGPDPRGDPMTAQLLERLRSALD